MSDLTESIDAFLVKYPDDAALKWRDPGPRRKPNALDVMIADLVTASERGRGEVL